MLILAYIVFDMLFITFEAYFYGSFLLRYCLKNPEENCQTSPNDGSDENQPNFFGA